MKTIYFLIIALFAGNGLFAQSSSLVFFTEEGEKFTLFVNGDKKNDTPQSRVTAGQIAVDFAQIKLEFETPGAPVVKQQMMIDPGMTMTSIIKRNKKGRYVMRPVSSVPLADDKTSETVRISEVVATPAPMEQQVTTVTTTTSQRTDQSTKNGGDNASVGISVTEGSANVSLNVNVALDNSDLEPLEEESTTTVTTTTYTESSTVQPEEAGCNAMTNDSFERAKKSINNKSFGDEKMTVMKQILKGNCVSVKQVIGFMELFTFEDNKLGVAKAAYSKTTDQGNYYQVNDALTYSESVEELSQFLDSQ
ncbi:DUF4476 domain-containing protein [Fulvivirga sp. M361]|uniref:DUF4476 domain-containing protein n=1 Tax=Fulvivirga sp. M361 TaxID=2594266 RepID=UPI00117B0EE1|nr:DUF4476 domain-containing protein [Fulvivirga sp. M361]TRX59906.1 DUF4476 domain-containing protein [Fulvivirga sp. M361]